MGLLRSVARMGARATGRALSRHVVPDSLIPSWKTQKTVSSGLSLLTKAARLVGNKKKKKKKSAAARPTARPSARPAPKAPKKKFDKNGWNMGRSLPNGFDVSSASSARSHSRALEPQQSASFLRKAKDLARNPRLVAQMGLDLLSVEYQLKKRSFLSKLKRPV